MTATTVDELAGIDDDVVTDEVVGVDEVVGLDEEVPPVEEVVSTDAEDPVDWFVLPPQPERTKTEPKTSASNVCFSMFTFLRIDLR